MKIVLSLLALLVAAPLAQAEMKWSGGAGVRYLNRKLNDGLENRDATGKDQSIGINKRWEFRGALGVSSASENLDWTVAMRTQSNQASEWVSTSNATDITFGLEQANARLHTNEWLNSEWAVTVGRQKAAFLFDSVAQAFLDRDVRFDGLGWNWKKGAIGVNLAQYVLGATSQGTAAQSSAFTSTEATQAVATSRSHFGMLYSIQPTFELKLSDDTKGLFALGYHNWSGTGGNSTSLWFSNQVHGGSAAPQTTGGGVGTTTATAPNDVNVSMSNTRQWQLLTDWTFMQKFRFVGEYIRNKTVYYGGTAPVTVFRNKAKRDAFSLSLIYGVAKKAHEWTVMYSYSDKGIASVINTFTNGDAPADNRSHMFEGKYMLADNVALGGKLQYHKEKGRVGGDGYSMPAPYTKRLQTQRRIELYSSISF